MTDEQRYLEWLEAGPSAQNLDTTRWAMKYEETHPTETLRLRQAYEQVAREAERVQLYVDTALMNGSSLEDARRDALEHVRAEREERITEDMSEQHRLAAQRLRQTF